MQPSGQSTVNRGIGLDSMTIKGKRCTQASDYLLRSSTDTFFNVLPRYFVGRYFLLSKFSPLKTG